MDIEQLDRAADAAHAEVFEGELPAEGEEREHWRDAMRAAMEVVKARSAADETLSAISGEDLGDMTGRVGMIIVADEHPRVIAPKSAYFPLYKLIHTVLFARRNGVANGQIKRMWPGCVRDVATLIWYRGLSRR